MSADTSASGGRPIWVDGQLLTPSAARVSVLDRGFTVGDGVFETLKVVEGVPFALTRHMDRLSASARGLGLVPPEPDTVRHAVEATIAAGIDALPPRARLRITLTAGAGAPGSERHGERPTLVVTVTPATEWPATDAVVVVPWRRNEMSAIAGLKTTSYAENVIALARAHDSGAGEALFANTSGELCEGTGSNVFVVVDGQLITPSLRSGCLPGITRALVLEWFGAQEADLPLSVLDDADEVMITSSTRDVQPVHAVDGRPLPKTPGPITAELQRVFAARSRELVDP